MRIPSTMACGEIEQADPEALLAREPVRIGPVTNLIDFEEFHC